MDAFAGLAPVSDGYATLPVGEAFDWSAVRDSIGTGEWYMVAFRSIRRPGADEVRLCEYDERAHLEASRSPGYLHYFKGPTAGDGSCLSFCIWASRPEAREAAAGPAHREAVTLLGEMYQEYRLEFLRVRRDVGGPLQFEAYDRT